MERTYYLDRISGAEDERKDLFVAIPFIDHSYAEGHWEQILIPSQDCLNEPYEFDEDLFNAIREHAKKSA